jgi:REP element-mobilizing transposase RayT
MGGIIHKEHNVSTLMYHIVCPAKYRKAEITEDADKELREICLGREARHEIKFLEIGTEMDHVHFLVQPVPTYSPERIVRTIKSITARKIFGRCPEVKKMLRGGEFRTKGYYAGSVGEHGDEQATQRYVKNQGRKTGEYQKIHEGKQLELFPYQNKA